MKIEWRFSKSECHVLFIAFAAHQNNNSLRKREGFTSIPTWIEVLRGTNPLVVAPAGVDEDFFPALVEQELLRLAPREPDDSLPCGCLTAEHRRTLQQFRIKNDLR